MQDFIAIAIVLLAAVFLGRRALRSVLSRRSGCGTCGNCPSNGPTLVNISNLSHGETRRREASKT